MDNPATESTVLNTDTAATAFAAILNADPEAEKPPEDKKPEQPEAKEPEAQDAQEAQEEAQQEAQDDDPVVTVKIDGRDVEVKLSELKNGYQRQADYTKKTTEVAEQRRAAEAERSKAMQERQAYAANLQRMQAQLEGTLQEQQQNVNWEKLLADDPVEYLKQRHLAESRQAQLNQVLAEQQRVGSQMQAEAEQARRAHLATQQQDLLAKLPHWADESKAKAEKTALREYLLKEGYDQATVDSLSNARDVLTARKAMLYDQLMGKAEVAAKKVSTLPTKVLQPGKGDANLDRRSSAFQRLGKTGKVEDAAAVFASLI